MATEHRKVYIPLESNPEVFTELIHKLGVADNVIVQDVYSLDDEDLIAMTPRPVYALIFNLISTEKYQRWRDEDEKNRPVYNGKGESEEVIWFEQTIHNACGFYGILHSISNGPAADHIRPHTPLDHFLRKIIHLDRDARTLALEDNDAIEKAYSEAAVQGDTAPPAIGEEVDYHYIAFVPNKHNNKIFLMDGVRKGPVDTGVALSPEEDFLPKALGIVKDAVSHIDGGVKFSLMALVQAP
ncbi:cysteine proteinase [Macrolepiota fuliginosa MF-IS2]|uniref:Ubiquitin carboxyl-terminal hydrolase n=1 Tax=Macrolepiota fuliginosa MF-IS2 TaxID=1400762 RepID=A0A9P6C6T1_9AGAR|nr:cysteine proteinase [Macrolepiota fuliginosa MF-IS2]